MIGNECNELQSLRFSLVKILTEYVPNAKHHRIEEIPNLIKEVFISLEPPPFDENLTPEVKSLKEQIASLQSKIKAMEEAKIEYDKYLLLEEEYKALKIVGAELSLKLDKIQSEKSVLSRGSRL